MQTRIWLETLRKGMGDGDIHCRIILNSYLGNRLWRWQLASLYGGMGPMRSFCYYGDEPRSSLTFILNSAAQGRLYQESSLLTAM